MANKHRKVWKVVSRKMNSGKQTWPKYLLINKKTFGLGKHNFLWRPIDTIKFNNNSLSLMGKLN
jgi:hypothetical protein